MKNIEVVVVATANQGKIKEIRDIMQVFGIQVISRDEAGVPADLEIAETGDTFEENSMIKAKAIMELTGMPTIADDSGLCVDFLDGAPEVYSSRFSGIDGDDEKNNEKLLELMKDAKEEERTGRFVSVVTFVEPLGEEITARGTVEGKLAYECRGANGFGYDSLFIPQEFDKTFGELDPALKNKLSHRAKALENLKKIFLEKNLYER